VTNKIDLTDESPILGKLNFRLYRSIVERQVERFQPGPNEPQSADIRTPWNEILKVKAGDYIVSEVSDPDDRWPVQAEIFEATYIVTRPGFCVKQSPTPFVPMVDAAEGNPDAEVTVHTLEGTYTIRAGDFYLARGPRGEIWAVPNDKVNNLLEPVHEKYFKPKI